jgi:hypothetical protein
MRQVETGEEPAEAPDNPRPDPAEPHAGLDPFALRSIAIMLGVIVAFFTLTGLVLVFKPFGDTPPMGEPSFDVFAAGPYDIYEPGTITPFETEKFFLVRTMDGAFIALYDLSPAGQAQVEAGDLEALEECRIVVREDDEIAEWVRRTSPIPGFQSIGLYDPCHDMAWDVRGRPVHGEHEADLDRFPVEATGEIVRVNLGHRRCMNDVSPEAPCIPTQ